jgi:AraC-like DNA-binding protein
MPFFPLYEGDVQISDWRCSGHPGPRGPEEACETWAIGLARSGVFERIDHRRSTVIDAGCVYFFSPGDRYRIAHPVAGGDESLVITLPAALAGEMLSAAEPRLGYAERPPFPRVRIPASPGVHLLHCRLERALAQPLAGRREIDELVHRLLEHLSGSLREILGMSTPRLAPATRRRHLELAEAARELLERRFQEPLSLAEIATCVGSSPFHLARVFRREIGVPVLRYRSGLRLRRAVDEILDGAPDLSELAHELGFADHAHFTNAFRREIGAPPSELRRHSRARIFKRLRRLPGKV